MFSKLDLEQLMTLRDIILDALTETTRLVESIDPALANQWIASGKQISDELSGLSLIEVIERLEERLEQGPELPEEQDSFNESTGRFDDSI